MRKNEFFENIPRDYFSSGDKIVVDGEEAVITSVDGRNKGFVLQNRGLIFLKKEKYSGVIGVDYCMYTIITDEFTSEFFGAHLKHLETKNWHFYKMFTGEILHFRKEHMVMVKETPVTEEEFNEHMKEEGKKNTMKGFSRN